MKTWQAITAAVLAVVGFAFGRWTSSAYEGASHDERATKATANQTADPVEALLAIPAPTKASGAGWLKRIFDGDLEALEAQLHEMDQDEATRLCIEVIARMDAETMRSLVDTYFIGDDIEALESWWDATGDLVPIAFAERWADLDPEGMLAYAEGRLARDGANPSEESDDPTAAQMIAIGAVMFVAKTHPERAYALAESMPGEWGEIGAEFALAAMAGSQPEQALAMELRMEGEPGYGFTMGMSPAQAAAALPAALALADEEARDKAVSRLIETWAENDPAGAFVAARDAGSVDGLEEVFSSWGDVDPRSASEALATLDLDADTQGVLAQILAERWARSEPAGVLEWARDRLDPAGFTTVLETALGNLPPEQAMQHFDPASGRSFRGSFIHLTQENPAAALDWLAEQPGGAVPPTLIGAASGVGEALAVHGPDVFHQAIDRIPQGNFLNHVIRSSMEFVGYEDPAAARLILADLHGDEHTAALGGMTMGWVERAPAEAAEFVVEQGDQTAIESALLRWSMMDPAALHGWVVENEGADPAVVAERVSSIGLANRWALRDPDAAGEAMLALPEGDAGPEVATVIGAWSQRDSIAASAFINDRLEPGFVRDSAVVALVEQIRARDPEGAAEWVATISDPDLRDSALAE